MKYFVVSDVHGFFTIMKKALDETAYDPNNPEHFFISCGDAFDRGNESNKVLYYFNSLPKERSVFVEGNHESTLKDYLTGKRTPHATGIRGGTMDTILQLTGVDSYYDFDIALNILSKNEEMYNYLSRLQNYYEIKNYVFIHGWIPRRYQLDGTFSFTDWRNACSLEWNNARCVNGFDEWYIMHKQETSGKSVREGKTIVCGHWHTSYAHVKYYHLGMEFPVGSAGMEHCHFETFEDDRIIGLDACTTLTHKINVLTFEE